MSVNVGVIGASGRMGQEIIQLIAADESLELAAAIERADSKWIGHSAYQVAGCNVDKKDCLITANLLGCGAAVDVLVDFTGAAGTMANLEAYGKLKKPVVIGSTGISDDGLAKIEALSKSTPVLFASNMSLGVNLAAKVTEMMARLLDDSFDIEIFEAHHRYKKDAPSGTALTLGKAAAKGRGVALGDVIDYSDRNKERKEGDIGFSVARGGDTAGVHTVYFYGDGECLELTHRASSRSMFAKGAIRAIKWMAGKPAGMYSINEVLGL